MVDVPLREFVEAILEEHDRRFDDLRAADAKALEEYKEDTRRALNLAKLNADRMVSLLLSISALIVSAATALFVYFGGHHP